MNRGALIGFVLLFDFLLIPVIAVLCAVRYYPKWMLTPDDPVSPFGLYEPAMLKAYGNKTPIWWRRWWGDFMWLALRNRGYGLAYAFKPAALYPDESGHYGHLHANLKPNPGRIERYSVFENNGKGCIYSMIKVHLFDVAGHPFGLMMGWKIDGIVMDPDTKRNAINMEGRPIFSPRRLD